MADVENTVEGGGSGQLAQAGEIYGGVHFHGHPGTAAPPPAQLPRDVPGFVGRQHELVKVFNTAMDTNKSNVIVLTGQPGVGKTSLAIRFGREHRTAFPDGQIYLDMRGMAPDPVAANIGVVRILRALGVPDDKINVGLDEQLDLYRTLCQRKKLLVVLDNVADEAQVQPLIASGCHCLTVVTSRNTLRGLPGVQRIRVDVLSPQVAVDMLAGIVGTDRVSAEFSAVERIVRSCGFLPLALRIAGTLADIRRGWSLDGLARRLSDERHRLDELKAGNEAVRASFQVSYDHLTPVTQAVFRCIPLVPGTDFTAELISPALAAGPRLEEELETLADYNLIGYGDNDSRYTIHDLLRLFAEESLAAHDTGEDISEAQDKVIGYAVSTAVKCSTKPPVQRRKPSSEQFAWLTENISNVLAAYILALNRRICLNILPAGKPIINYLRRREKWVTARYMIDSSIAALEPLRRRPECEPDQIDDLELTLLWKLCELSMDTNDYPLLVHLGNRLVAFDQRSSLLVAPAVVLTCHGLIHQVRGDIIEAVEHFEQALLICKRNKYYDLVPSLYDNIGLCQAMAGRPQEAVDYVKAGREIRQLHGEP